MPHQSLVVADPDYDLEQLEPARKRPTVLLAQRGVDLRAGESVPDNWSRLPGTAQEADALAPTLKNYLGESLEVRLADQAREPVVKRVKRPRVLVLSTHGFFLPDVESEVAATVQPVSLGEDQFRRAPPNPLLRCGIVLAGANRSDGTAAEDGVLTGLEIVNLNLRGTRLVVLSACETGLGDVRTGEGVAGLRQAFRLAGAQHVLATLWRIPDAETATLMNGFWESIAKGTAISTAVRDAQLAMIAAARENGEIAPPFAWAAFTITGRPGFPTAPLSDVDKSEHAKLVNEAREANDAGEHNQAVATCNTLLLRFPRSVDGYAHRGYACLRLRRYEEALCDLTEVLRINPRYVWAYLGRAEVYRRFHRADLALRDSSRAVDLAPDDAHALAERGTARWLLKDYDAAVADLDRAVSRAPKFPFAWNSRGIAHRLRGDLEAALANHDKAIELAPNWAYAYQSRALVNERLGNKARADADRKKARNLAQAANVDNERAAE